MTINRKPDEWMDEIEATAVPHGCVAVWFLGQESVILKGSKTVIYIDPWISDLLEQQGANRDFKSPFQPEAVRQADLCLITHEHADHLDEGTLRVLAHNCPAVPYVAPACCRGKMVEWGVRDANISDAAAGEWLEYGEARILPIAAAHEELEVDELGRHRFVGYLIEMNGVTLYHAGDTVIYPGLVDNLKSYGIDLGMLPINGGDFFRREKGLVGNMDYREAAELAVQAGMETVVPLHYDGFRYNGEKPGYFVQYLYENHPYQKSHVMAQAERFIYVSSRAFR